jgi:hypothetical protein
MRTLRDFLLRSTTVEHALIVLAFVVAIVAVIRSLG